MSRAALYLALNLVLIVVMAFVAAVACVTPVYLWEHFA